MTRWLVFAALATVVCVAASAQVDPGWVNSERTLTEPAVFPAWVVVQTDPHGRIAVIADEWVDGSRDDHTDYLFLFSKTVPVDEEVHWEGAAEITYAGDRLRVEGSGSDFALEVTVKKEAAAVTGERLGIRYTGGAELVVYHFDKDELPPEKTKLPVDEVRRRIGEIPGYLGPPELEGDLWDRNEPWAASCGGGGGGGAQCDAGGARSRGCSIQGCPNAPTGCSVSCGENQYACCGCVSVNRWFVFIRTLSSVGQCRCCDLPIMIPADGTPQTSWNP